MARYKDWYSKHGLRKRLRKKKVSAMVQDTTDGNGVRIRLTQGVADGKTNVTAYIDFDRPKELRHFVSELNKFTEKFLEKFDDQNQKDDKVPDGNSS